MNCYIRDVEKGDLKELAKIRNTPQQFKKYLKETKTKQAKFLTYIVNNEKIGFGRLKTGLEKKSLRPMISDVWIKGKYRSKGFGSDFIKKMENVLKKLKYKKIYIGVDYNKNKRALSLYKELGYKEIQDEPYKKEGIYYDQKTGKPYKKTYWRIDLAKTVKNT